MLAGVTGVILRDECSCGACCTLNSTGAGGAGGGILRSTGEGLSPTTISSAPLAGVPVLRPPGRVERMSGVLEADLVPRRVDRAGPGWVGTIAGDGLGRPYRAASSSLGEAVRLLRPLLECEDEPSCLL